MALGEALVVLILAMMLEQVILALLVVEVVEVG